MFNNFAPFPSFSNGFQYQGLTAQPTVQPVNSYVQAYQQQTQQIQQNTNITFVNGIEGAKAFQLSPNSSMLMMDSDNSKFYVKTTDNLGVAKISSYSFSECDLSEKQNEQDKKDTNTVNISSEDYNSLVAKVSELESFKSDMEVKLKDLI